jgi:hypothetical protein
LSRLPMRLTAFRQRTVSLSRPFPSHLSKSHTHAATVVLDEFDAGRFKGVTNHNQRCPAGLIYACFQLADGHDPHLRFPCEILLTPVEQASRGSALGGRNHKKPPEKGRSFSPFISKID